MFVDVSGLVLHNPPGLHYGVAVADLDGDGRFEFAVAGFGGPNRVLRWAGGQLRDAAPPLGLARTAGGRGVLTLPVFSDRPDVFCVNEQGPNFAFRNRGDGTFEECAAELGLTDPEEHGRGVAAFDAGDAEFALCWG